MFVPHSKLKRGFKSYITQSRRAILLACHEAKQTGSGFIGPENLLLWMLRSDKVLAMRLLKTKENIESIGGRHGRHFHFEGESPSRWISL